MAATDSSRPIPLKILSDQQLQPVADAFAPLWGGDEAARLSFTGSFLGAFSVSICMLLIWRIVLSPAIPQYHKRPEADRVFLANSFVSLWPAFTAPILALTAMRELPWEDLSQMLTVQADEYALRAVGISCGYMLYDTLYCLAYRQMRSPLIIGHHVLPVIMS